MDPSAALVLEGLGGDPSYFSARQLTARIANSADLILGMTKAHRDAVLELVPQKLPRTFTLAEAAGLAAGGHVNRIEQMSSARPLLSSGETLDVEDPVGRNLSTFEAVGLRIADLLRPVINLCSGDE